MAVIKCKMCGGDLNLIEGASTAECEYCGSVQTVPKVDDEKKLTLFARANRLRAACEFDKAAGIYETIVADFPEEAEAYWGLVLCKYGIEYVDDPATGKKIPTCHRSAFDSVLKDADFEQAQENADPMARRIYREEAKAIEELRRGIIAVSANEEPYDIFICYKETAEDGQRTLDSVLAQEIYDALTDKGYRVFFSRIPLEDKLGVEYEPYIFAALNSARIMLVVGTDYEHFNAVWVKNEWSRFLKLMAKDKQKYLVPCFKGIDAYDMPEEFARLQAQDLGKMGAIQDILRGVEKLLPRKQESQVQLPAKQVVYQQAASGNVAPLLERMFLFLEDKQWKSADEYAEKVLDQDPKNAEAYLGKLLAKLQLPTRQALGRRQVGFKDEPYYEKITRFGSDGLKAEMTGYLKQIASNILDESYRQLLSAMAGAKTSEQFHKLAEGFTNIKDHRDAALKAQQCREKARQLDLHSRYQGAFQAMNSALTAEELRTAAVRFDNLTGYQNSKEMAAKCRQEADNLPMEAKRRWQNYLPVQAQLIPYKEQMRKVQQEKKSLEASLQQKRAIRAQYQEKISEVITLRSRVNQMKGERWIKELDRIGNRLNKGVFAFPSDRQMGREIKDLKGQMSSERDRLEELERQIQSFDEQGLLRQIAGLEQAVQTLDTQNVNYRNQMKQFFKGQDTAVRPLCEPRIIAFLVAQPQMALQVVEIPQVYDTIKANSRLSDYVLKFVK